MPPTEDDFENWLADMDDALEGFFGRLPAAVRPALTAMIGFFRPTRLAIRANRRGFPKDSRYRRIASTRLSSSQYKSRSLPETSALFPTLTKCERPNPRLSAKERIASPSAPLCEEKAM